MNVLSSILDHGLGERALLPEIGIVLHLAIDLVFFGVYLASVLFKKIVQADVNISIIVVLEEIRDQPVSNLRVKDEITDQVVLTDEGGSVFAEVMKDLHYLVGLKHFFEAMMAWIHSSQV